MNKALYYLPEMDRRNRQVLDCDLCVYGGTAAGVIAAVEARRRGLRVVLLVNGLHIGGLTTGGLGYTDFGNKDIVGGLAREFYRKLGEYYGLDEEWRFEPSAAQRVIDTMLREAGVEPILRQYLESATMENGCISSLRLESGLEVRAGMYMDASYEGDLMAAAGVSYAVGREGNHVYGEFCNGIQVREHHQFLIPVSPYRIPGEPRSGLLPGISDGPLAAQGSGDNRIQAYNFRVCMTQAASRIPFPKPEGYDPELYELLARYLDAGWRGLYVKFDSIQGGKTDTNNHGPFSSDYIGANYAYPEATYAQREAIVQDHVRYHQGLLWFLANDSRVPGDIRQGMSTWGLAEDEFQMTGNWPAQIYVREARRMCSDYVNTEWNCRGIRRAPDPIAFGAYHMDSHNCQRVVVGDRVLNEGDVQIAVKPYPISYRSVIPSLGEAKNLFVPVCLSATHIAYGSIRMEPVFMMLAQSCAIAASLCLKDGLSVQELDYRQLRDELLSAGQVLSYETHDGEGWLSADPDFAYNPTEEVKC